MLGEGGVVVGEAVEGRREVVLKDVGVELEVVVVLEGLVVAEGLVHVGFEGEYFVGELLEGGPVVVQQSFCVLGVL